MRNIFRLILSGFAAASLAACGGSGSNAPVPPLENLAQITSANAPQISGAVLKATFEGGDLGSFADLSSGIGGATITKSSGVYKKVGEIQINYTKPMLAESQIGTFQAPIAPIESMCESGGRTVVSGDIANPQTLSPNDVITIEFIGCNDGLSVVDGVLSMTIRAFSGDFVSGSVSFEVDVSLDAFSVTENGETATADGIITIGMEFSLAGPITMTIASGNLSISDGVSTETLASFSLVQAIDTVSNTYTLTVSGRISSSIFEGAVDFSTSVDLEGSGDEFAFVGQLVITGDANATITIVVLDNQLIRLNVDLDGDGSTDEVIDTSWDELT
jgi:hypothetical protein